MNPSPPKARQRCVGLILRVMHWRFGSVNMRTASKKDRFFEDMENYAYAFCDSALTDYLPSALVVCDDYKHIKAASQSRMDIFLEKLKTMIENKEAIGDQHALYLAADEWLHRARAHDVIDLCAISASRDLKPRCEINIRAKNALSYNRQIGLLGEDLKARIHGGWRVGLFCGDAAKARKLAQELSDDTLTAPVIEDGRVPGPGEAAVYPDTLISGFELSTAKLYFLGEREIYGFARKRKKTVSKKNQLDIFTDLKTGDLIVHDVHGKGRFLGLVTRDVQGISRDYLELEYRGGDKLFIPTESDRPCTKIHGRRVGTALEAGRQGVEPDQGACEKCREGAC